MHIALEAARQKVDGNAEAQAAFDAEQAQLANGFDEGLTYELLLRRLGMDGKKGGCKKSMPPCKSRSLRNRG